MMMSFFSISLVLVYLAILLWVVIVVVKLLTTLTDYLSSLNEEVRLRMARSAQENARRE